MARRKTALEQVQQIAVANGSNCVIFCGDIADEQFVNESMQKLQRQFGQIDVLVNNAGFGIFKPTEEIRVAQWEDVFATNTKGTFLMTKAVIAFVKTKQVVRYKE
jgi:NADP-dependent 3-hydroxy acid dehydrogenase YdfG